MHTRDLSTAQCVAYALRPNNMKVAVDWNTPTSPYLVGSEVNTIRMYTACYVNCHMHNYYNVSTQ